jgi:hypothetical protein
MPFSRRSLLGGVAIAGALAARGVAASTEAAVAIPSTTGHPGEQTLNRISSGAAEVRRDLSYRDGGFSGPGWEMLLEEGRRSQFFLVGEEHGIAECPKLVTALFGALAPNGYDHLAIETSGPMAGALSDAAANGLGGLRQLFTEPGSTPAFFGLREESEMLASVRRLTSRRDPFWGLDYEVAADRRLIAELETSPKPQRAAAALKTLKGASDRAWE